MHRTVRRPTRWALVVAAMSLLAVGAAPTAAADRSFGGSIDRGTLARPAVARPAVAGDLLPDLRMGRLRDMQIDVDQSPGRVYLRFTTVEINIGAGPFEVDSVLTDDPTTMSTKQRIFSRDSQGALTSRTQPTNAIAKYAGDGHDHWHVMRMQRYQLFSKATPGAPAIKGSKVGFCFSDNADMRPLLPGHPDHPIYTSCGNQASTTITMGLSVGWGDVYPASITFQWIDITGVPSGDYRVCVTVDPQHFYTESNTTNNQTWSDITLDMDAATPTVAVTGMAWASCQ